MLYTDKYLLCSKFAAERDVTSHYENTMTPILKSKIIEVCDKKIATKGEGVGISFYAFFKNKNDEPELLMEASEWWIRTHQLDHFEKAVKVKALAYSN